MKLFTGLAKKYLEKKGYAVLHPSVYRSDMEPEFLSLWELVRQHTMISPERGYNIYKAVEYIAGNNIPGDMVECGVWKGGAGMLIALSLLKSGDTGRKIFMYDTYSGMTCPGDNDCIAWNGKKMLERWKLNREKEGKNLWAAGIDEVRKNMISTGYPAGNIEFIEGDVLETLNTRKPDMISLLRLDTDWYESTKKELETLYPLLTEKGILIIDDYGHFTGAKKAVDEYFQGRGNHCFLNRIDYTGRSCVKID